MMINPSKTLHGMQRSWTHLFCVFFFACMVDKKQKTPNLSSMADDAITRDGIPGLGSSLYICGINRSLEFYADL